MQRSTLFLVLAMFAMACQSDQKLQDDPNPGGLPGDGNIPGTTDDPGNGTNTETNPDTTDTTTDTTGNGTTPTDGNGNPVGDDDDGGTVPTTLPEPGDTGLTDEEICTAAATLAGFLDPYQTPNDGHVLYCHALHLNDSDISSCLPHLNHGTDTFPTTGCDT